LSYSTPLDIHQQNTRLNRCVNNIAQEKKEIKDDASHFPNRTKANVSLFLKLARKPSQSAFARLSL
jgi:hypothetical protein